MTDSIKNRKTLRAAIAADIVTHVTNAKVVFAYLGDPLKKMPAIAIQSRGTAQTDIGYDHLFTAHLLVLAGAGAWTEAQAEDALDDLSWQFQSYIIEQTYPTLVRDGDSSINMVDIDDEQYLDEEIPFRVRAVKTDNLWG